jgi:tetrahydromethanopterin S-methyltransferase subunit G
MIDALTGEDYNQSAKSFVIGILVGIILGMLICSIF